MSLSKWSELMLYVIMPQLYDMSVENMACVWYETQCSLLMARQGMVNCEVNLCVKITAKYNSKAVFGPADCRKGAFLSHQQQLM